MHSGLLSPLHAPDSGSLHATQVPWLPVQRDGGPASETFREMSRSLWLLGPRTLLLVSTGPQNGVPARSGFLSPLHAPDSRQPAFHLSSMATSAEGAFQPQKHSGECPGISIQDYKFPHVAVVICATLVNTQTYKIWLVILSTKPAELKKTSDFRLSTLVMHHDKVLYPFRLLTYVCKSENSLLGIGSSDANPPKLASPSPIFCCNTCTNTLNSL